MTFDEEIPFYVDWRNEPKCKHSFQLTVNTNCPSVEIYMEQHDEEIIADEIRKFAEWLPQHFDLRFSNNPDVWVDEFFNHTRDKILAEYKKREAMKGGAE